MARTKITSYRGVLVTEDTARALEALTGKLSEGGWVLKPMPPEDYERGNPLSLLPAGREVRVQVTPDDDPQRAVVALWAAAVPMGFTPRSRYPLVDDESRTLHFFGPWQAIYDRLSAEGRGHLVWPSICCAAQVEVEVWEGGRRDIRFVQAQLHRIGLNAGAVDGVVGDRTKACLQYLGLGSVPFPKVVEVLLKLEPPVEEKQTTTTRGHLVVPHYKLRAQGFGGVRAWVIDKGVGLEVNGPGRLVVDVT